MRITKTVLLFLLLIIPCGAGAGNQEHLVTLPIYEATQLTCKWWNATKGKTDRKQAEAIANAFLEGFAAGRSETTKLYFVDGSKMRWVAEATTAAALSAIDDYCQEFAHKPWTGGLLSIYQQRQELSLSPGAKRQASEPTR